MKKIKIYGLIILSLTLIACDNVKKKEESALSMSEIQVGMYKDEKGNIYYGDGRLYKSVDGSLVVETSQTESSITRLPATTTVTTGAISDTGMVNYSEGSSTYSDVNIVSSGPATLYDEDGIPVGAVECNNSIPECREFGFNKDVYLDQTTLNQNTLAYQPPSNSQGAITTIDWNQTSTKVNQFAIKSDGKTVYFNLDQSTIKRNYIKVLRRHANDLINNQDLRVLIEGHADERGSREYNIALSERRAKAVQRFLEAEGVLWSQMTTVAYGEERPNDMGHNQSAWAKNRRAILVYQ